RVLFRSDIHVGELPEQPLQMMLRMNDGRQFSPVDSTVVKDSYHHRATVVRFPSRDDHGKTVMNENSSSFELIVHDPTVHVEQAMQWDLPIIYPKDLNNASDLSLPTVFGLLAGLLAVLSPCLLELTVYCTFALAGINVHQKDGVERGSGFHVMCTVLFVVAAFNV